MNTFFEKDETRCSVSLSENESDDCIAPKRSQHASFVYVGTGVTIGKTSPYYSPSPTEGDRTDINDIIDKVASLAINTERSVSIYRKCNKYLWRITDRDGKVGQVLLNLLRHHVGVASDTTKTVYIESDNIFVDIIEAQRRRIRPGEYVKVSFSVACEPMMQGETHLHHSDSSPSVAVRYNTCHKTSIAYIRAYGGLLTYSAGGNDCANMTILLPVYGTPIPVSYRIQ
ncbi:MAG: hypothetical protein JXC33_04955 [Deltaproteobacteria bacterium]|nr:hypothetical protein [Deltaproteobacteria bacterium]